MEDIVIKSWRTKFKKGFIPEEGQKIFISCPICKTLHEVYLGQGLVNKNNTCTSCNHNFRHKLRTYNLFKNTSVYFVYSNIRYVEPYMIKKNDWNLNSNIRLAMSISKKVGEVFFEYIWDIFNDDFIQLHLFLKTERNKDSVILVNREDSVIFLYLKTSNSILDRVYTIDKDYNISKLNNIEASINMSLG